MRAVPPLCVLMPALPFATVRGIGGMWVYGVTVLFVAGLVRIALLHHVGRSVKPRCRMPGERPFRTRRHDQATNRWRRQP
ncbi:hypothetical protein ADL00_05330 [Streptomyces sp. AS58]|uniref:Uncharacterized protein n=1 Tax=Streptomyces cadmiisoli TaxID=2184053 RepID=A0A2Z4ISS7_9ACTN|nr:hypothetical protein DN051_03345 [Streptomyces cadmiisoli]KOV72910.1 hypothetical protein ADL00_05330 [Streptomyces sp. AS58]